MNTAVNAFLAKHNFVNHVDIYSVAQAILDDMRKGLKKEPADQDMIRTFCNPPENSACGKSVIVIDAGGTNFRSCLVTFDENGNPQISEMEKTKMPGVEKELSREEFFQQFATNLEHLKNKADRIGFCFSYPMEIKENGDCVLLGFSKEVKAPEVVGSAVGKCLKEELEKNGWNSIKRITLCNDTVAALLAGAACAIEGDRFSSYIGYILGTGMNAAYLQPTDKEFNITGYGYKYSNLNKDFSNEFTANDYIVENTTNVSNCLVLMALAACGIDPRDDGYNRITYNNKDLYNYTMDEIVELIVEKKNENEEYNFNISLNVLLRN